MNYKCKVCGGACIEIKYDKITSTYHKCATCDFISKDEASYVTPKQEKKIYDTHNNSADDPVYVAYFQDFIDTCLTKFIDAPSTALDFGSGPVPVLAQILRNMYAIEVDIFDKYYAPEKVYEGKRYDLITVTEVVEHLEDPIEYFALFKSLLKPGGVLAMMTQFHHNDEKGFEHWHYRRDESHVSFFTPKTMVIIADKIGFEIVYIDTHKYVVFKANM